VCHPPFFFHEISRSLCERPVSKNLFHVKDRRKTPGPPLFSPHCITTGISIPGCACHALPPPLSSTDGLAAPQLLPLNVLSDSPPFPAIPFSLSRGANFFRFQMPLSDSRRSLAPLLFPSRAVFVLRIVGWSQERTFVFRAGVAPPLILFWRNPTEKASLA